MKRHLINILLFINALSWFSQLTDGRFLPQLNIYRRNLNVAVINQKKYGRLTDIRRRKIEIKDGAKYSPLKLNLWKSKTGEKLIIPYGFRSDFPGEFREFVEKAILAMNKQLQCGHDIWVPVRNKKKHHIVFIQDDGCWSLLGKDDSERIEQPISIAEGCQDKNVVLHEMMHAMGFHHEHNRVDRDKYIKIIWKNIQKGLEEQFEKTSSNNIFETNVGYDLMSIMHYDLTSFSKNGKPTMEIKKTKQALQLNNEQLRILGNVPDLSTKDIQELRMYFNCDNALPTEIGTTARAITTEMNEGSSSTTESFTTSSLLSTDPEGSGTTSGDMEYDSDYDDDGGDE